jgi:putative intracellular protease/amidase
MPAPAEPFRIVFAIFPGMTHLDFTGPHQVLSRAPKAETIVAAKDGGTVEGDGLHFANVRKLSEIDRCDLICVPGGTNATKIALDETFVGEVRRLASGAKYVTSVCTGSLILGAAGLLKGKRSACHWAYRELLPLFGAIVDEGRVVRDGNVITGGGVTAGIDFAFTLLAEIAGRDVAETVQLGLEYAPSPPFDSGRPELARPEILAGYGKFRDRIMSERRAEAEQAASAMKATA